LNKPFLTAEWRDVAMLNFVIDPSALQPLVPPGTELDDFQGRTFASDVGFRFLRTRVCGIRFPFHRNFEEVNLRFYVRRRAEEGWRRGVVFIRELVPRRIIAFVARAVYGEPYSALPMRHRIERSAAQISAEYGWKRRGRWESLRMTAPGNLQEVAAGSEEEFITEHYWGYTARGTSAREYQVEHPRWKLSRATGVAFDADIASLYGEQFVQGLSAQPASAFIADGSPVIVRRGSNISPNSHSS
jgi:uncharacterized protein YqjF (DUF2071 family)